MQEKTYNQTEYTVRFSPHHHLIEAGKYNSIDEVIAETVEQTLILVHPDETTNAGTVFSYFKKKNLEPASIVDLLVFGAQHPDIQMQFPIIALGARFNLNMCPAVPYLSSLNRKRVLSLGLLNSTWYTQCRFLAKVAQKK